MASLLDLADSERKRRIEDNCWCCGLPADQGCDACDLAPLYVGDNIEWFCRRHDRKNRIDL